MAVLKRLRLSARWPPALLAAAAVTAAVSALCGTAATARSLSDYAADGAKVGGDFTLTTQDGGTLSLKELRGEVVVLTFGYTHCPDICPLSLQQMTAVLRALGRRADQVRMVFITVDPQRDTPRHLKAYLGFFGTELIGLTGSEEQIRAVANAYSAMYQKSTPVGAGGYEVAHTGFVYVIDARGKVRYVLPHDGGSGMILQAVIRFLAPPSL